MIFFFARFFFFFHITLEHKADDTISNGPITPSATPSPGSTISSNDSTNPLPNHSFKVIQGQYEKLLQDYFQNNQFGNPADPKMDPAEMKLQAYRMAMMYQKQQQQGGGAASTNSATPPPQVTPSYVQQQQWLYHQQHYLQQQQQFYAATSLANGSNDMSSLANQNAYYSFSPMTSHPQSTNQGQENHVIHQNSMSPATPNPATPIMEDKDEPPQKVLVLDSESSQQWHQENYNNSI